MSRLFYFYLSMVIEIKYSVGDFEQASRLFLSQCRKHFHPTSLCENSINLSLKANKKKKKRRRNSRNWNNYSWPPRITNYRNGSSSRGVLRHETVLRNDPRSRNYCYSYFLTLRQTSKGISLRLTVESSDWTLPDNGILM